jgi:hypothetical protein
MLTWNECCALSLDATEAAYEMNCSLRTARKMLKETQGRNARNADRFARDLHRLAVTETRPSSERSAYPSDCIELSDRYLDEARNHVYGPITNRQRNVLAKGMPPNELTRRDGSSRADYWLKPLQS